MSTVMDSLLAQARTPMSPSGNLGALLPLVMSMGGGGAPPERAVRDVDTGNYGNDVRGWLQEAMSLTGVNQSWLKPLMKLVQHESGGNPNARNDTPVASGQHAQGLLQTIPSTFDAYNMNRLGNDITDPVQNAVAAIRYIMSRYGHVRKTPLFTEGGGGY